MTSSLSPSCPRCNAGPLAPCVPVGGDIEPGVTHRERTEAWAAAPPRTMYDETPEHQPVPVRTDARQMKIGG